MTSPPGRSLPKVGSWPAVKGSLPPAGPPLTTGGCPLDATAPAPGCRLTLT